MICIVGRVWVVVFFGGVFFVCMVGVNRFSLSMLFRVMVSRDREGVDGCLVGIWFEWVWVVWDMIMDMVMFLVRNDIFWWWLEVDGGRKVLWCFCGSYML